MVSASAIEAKWSIVSDTVANTNNYYFMSGGDAFYPPSGNYIGGPNDYLTFNTNGSTSGSEDGVSAMGSYQLLVDSGISMSLRKPDTDECQGGDAYCKCAHYYREGDGCEWVDARGDYLFDEIKVFWGMQFRYALVFFVLFSTGRCFAQVTAAFTTSVSTVCANSPVGIINTSTGASSYYWSFCAADFNSTPEALNLGNPGGKLASPTFGCYSRDDDGTYYGLVTSYNDGDLIQLNFGNSLLNTPTAVDLGTFGGALPNQCEGIQLLRVNHDWTAIVVGGGGQVTNSSPRVVKIDFGTSLGNTPTATNWGDIGGLNLPHDLFIGMEGGNYYGFAINVNDNTLTRLSFGPDFNSTPTGINMGNIGGINYPAGLTFVNYNSNWYCFIANRDANSLTRLDFGNSLLNTPTGGDIGNPGSLLSYPRDVSLFTTCDGVYGFVVNEQSNELIKLNFGNDPTSNPAATDLGNVGNLSFPHSISDFFRVGNDIYAFIPNVSSSSLTRIRFAGCPNIPGSEAMNPLPVTYTSPGVYNINLLVDLGLPTQTSYCQQVVVYASPKGQLTGDTVCYGNSPALLYTSSAGVAPFNISYTDGVNTYSQAGLSNQGNVPLPYALTAAGGTTFTLKTVTDADGCSFDTSQATQALIAPIPDGGITGSTVCGADSALIVFGSSTGPGPFSLTINNGSTTENVTNVSSTLAFKAPLLTTATNFTLEEITDQFGCTRTSGFSPATVAVVPLPNPVLQFPVLGGICIDKGPLQLNSAVETSGLGGSGAYSGPGVDAAGVFHPSEAGAGVHTIVYTYTADDGCVLADSSLIVVNSLPVGQAPQVITACDGIPVHLVASGGASYVWSPATYLSDPAIANPVASVGSTTTYVVQVTDSNGCMVSDTLTIKDAGTIQQAFVIPNAFTPNGDGHNDCFGIRQWGSLTLRELDIFNRDGGKVFSTQHVSDCWDGYFDGQLQPAGAYVYVIRALTACGEVTRTGTVLLIR